MGAEPKELSAGTDVQTDTNTTSNVQTTTTYTTTTTTTANGETTMVEKTETQQDHDNTSASSLDHANTAEKGQAGGNDVQNVRTISRVPGNPNYFEKDGLRTYGDGVDHEAEGPMTFAKFMALVGMSFLWTGSQIPVYLFGGCLPIIYGDIGGADIYTWSILGNLLALAAVTPFVGSLSDLFGRRWVAIGGSVFIVAGMIASSVAQNMQVFIVGMVIAGAGAGVCELIALAATGEMVPTKKRGLYVGLVVCTITPYCPAVVYAQLIAEHSWRYNGLWCGLWSFIGLLLVVFFYHPPPRVNSTGLTRKEVLQRIDFVGALLSVSGLVLFLAALQWGGNKYPWTSAHVLAPLFIGVACIIGFGCWEKWGAPYPMFPARLKKDPRNLYLILFVTAVSGANFFAVLVFWPTQSYLMYDPDPVLVGVRSLPIGFGIIAGAVVVGILITVLNGRIRLLLTASCIVMTVGTGTMALATRDNMDGIYAAITFAALGVGAVIIPNQIIVTIICPDDLIATSTALALCVRVIGGSIGYAVYYNVFRERFTSIATDYFGLEASKVGFYTIEEITELAFLVSEGLYKDIAAMPQITSQAEFNALYIAGKETCARAFPVVWYAAVGFGAATVVACIFLKDIGKYMDGHVAVRM